MSNDDIIDILNKLNETISENNIILKRIEEKMDNEITSECRKMGSHIDFIESVYEKVRNPINYLCDKFGSTKQTDLATQERDTIENVNEYVNEITTINKIKLK
jgi:uncharacterized coiled-coil protein SlyX